MDSVFKNVKFFVIQSNDDKITDTLKQLGAINHPLLSESVRFAVSDDASLVEVGEADELYAVPVVTLTDSDCLKIWAYVNIYGGQVQHNLDKAVTHVISSKASGKFYDYCKEHLSTKEVILVTPDWIVDCLTQNKIIPHEPYHPDLLISPVQPKVQSEEKLISKNLNKESSDLLKVQVRQDFLKQEDEESFGSTKPKSLTGQTQHFLSHPSQMQFQKQPQVQSSLRPLVQTSPYCLPTGVGLINTVNMGNTITQPKLMVQNVASTLPGTNLEAATGITVQQLNMNALEQKNIGEHGLSTQSKSGRSGNSRSAAGGSHRGNSQSKKAAQEQLRLQQQQQQQHQQQQQQQQQQRFGHPTTPLNRYSSPNGSQRFAVARPPMGVMTQPGIMHQTGNPGGCITSAAGWTSQVTSTGSHYGKSTKSKSTKHVLEQNLNEEEKDAIVMQNVKNILSLQHTWSRESSHGRNSNTSHSTNSSSNSNVNAQTTNINAHHGSSAGHSNVHAKLANTSESGYVTPAGSFSSSQNPSAGSLVSSAYTANPHHLSNHATVTAISSAGSSTGGNTPTAPLTNTNNLVINHSAPSASLVGNAGVYRKPKSPCRPGPIGNVPGSGIPITNGAPSAMTSMAPLTPHASCKTSPKSPKNAKFSNNTNSTINKVLSSPQQQQQQQSIMIAGSTNSHTISSVLLTSNLPQIQYHPSANSVHSSSQLPGSQGMAQFLATPVPGSGQASLSTVPISNQSQLQTGLGSPTYIVQRHPSGQLVASVSQTQPHPQSQLQPQQTMPSQVQVHGQSFSAYNSYQRPNGLLATVANASQQNPTIQQQFQSNQVYNQPASLTQQQQQQQQTTFYVRTARQPYSQSEVMTEAKCGVEVGAVNSEIESDDTLVYANASDHSHLQHHQHLQPKTSIGPQNHAAHNNVHQQYQMVPGMSNQVAPHVYHQSNVTPVKEVTAGSVVPMTATSGNSVLHPPPISNQQHHYTPPLTPNAHLPLQQQQQQQQLIKQAHHIHPQHGQHPQAHQMASPHYRQHYQQHQQVVQMQSQFQQPSQPPPQQQQQQHVLVQSAGSELIQVKSSHPPIVPASYQQQQQQQQQHHHSSSHHSNVHASVATPTSHHHYQQHQQLYQSDNANAIVISDNRDVQHTAIPAPSSSVQLQIALHSNVLNRTGSVAIKPGLVSQSPNNNQGKMPIEGAGGGGSVLVGGSNTSAVQHLGVHQSSLRHLNPTSRPYSSQQQAALLASQVPISSSQQHEILPNSGTNPNMNIQTQQLQQQQQRKVQLPMSVGQYQAIQNTGPANVYSPGHTPTQQIIFQSPNGQQIIAAQQQQSNVMRHVTGHPAALSSTSASGMLIRSVLPNSASFVSSPTLGVVSGALNSTSMYGQPHLTSVCTLAFSTALSPLVTLSGTVISNANRMGSASSSVSASPPGTPFGPGTPSKVLFQVSNVNSSINSNNANNNLHHVLQQPHLQQHQQQQQQIQSGLILTGSGQVAQPHQLHPQAQHYHHLYSQQQQQQQHQQQQNQVQAKRGHLAYVRPNMPAVAIRGDSTTFIHPNSGQTMTAVISIPYQTSHIVAANNNSSILHASTNNYHHSHAHPHNYSNGPSEQSTPNVRPVHTQMIHVAGSGSHSLITSGSPVPNRSGVSTQSAAVVSMNSSAHMMNSHPLHHQQQQQQHHHHQQQQLAANSTLPVNHNITPTYYGHDGNPLPSRTEDCLIGCVLLLLGYRNVSESQRILWRRVIRSHGAEIVMVYDPNRVTHIVLDCQLEEPDIVKQALLDRKRLVTIYWINDILAKGRMVPPFEILHLPSPFSHEITFSFIRAQIVSLTGFEGKERQKIEVLIRQLGAVFTDYLEPTNTLLICKQPSGKKYEMALLWDIPCVNVRWLQDLYLGDLNSLSVDMSHKYLCFETADVTTALDRCTPRVQDLMVGWQTPIRLSRESWIRSSKLSNDFADEERERKRKLEAENAVQSKSKKSTCLLALLSNQEIDLAMSCRSRHDALKAEELQARQLWSTMQTELTAAKAALIAECASHATFTLPMAIANTVALTTPTEWSTTKSVSASTIESALPAVSHADDDEEDEDGHSILLTDQDSSSQIGEVCDELHNIADVPLVKTERVDRETNEAVQKADANKDDKGDAIVVSDEVDLAEIAESRPMVEDTENVSSKVDANVGGKMEDGADAKCTVKVELHASDSIEHIDNAVTTAESVVGAPEDDDVPMVSIKIESITSQSNQVEHTKPAQTLTNLICEERELSNCTMTAANTKTSATTTTAPSAIDDVDQCAIASSSTNEPNSTIGLPSVSANGLDKDKSRKRPLSSPTDDCDLSIANSKRMIVSKDDDSELVSEVDCTKSNEVEMKDEVPSTDTVAPLTKDDQDASTKDVEVAVSEFNHTRLDSTNTPTTEIGQVNKVEVMLSSSSSSLNNHPTTDALVCANSKRTLPTDTIKCGQQLSSVDAPAFLSKSSILSGQIRVTFTAIEIETRLTLADLCAQLPDCTVVDTIDEATHLVTNRLVRTPKTYRAVALGRFIVTPKWIQASVLRGFWLDEMSWLLSDPEAEAQFGIRLKESILCARKRQVLGLETAGLFAGLEFWLSPAACHREMCITLIKDGGGIIRQRRPTQKMALLPQPKQLIICHEDDSHVANYLMRTKTGNRAVHHEEFILSGILRQELDYDAYQIQYVNTLQNNLKQAVALAASNLGQKSAPSPCPFSLLPNSAPSLQSNVGAIMTSQAAVKHAIGSIPCDAVPNVNVDDNTLFVRKIIGARSELVVPIVSSSSIGPGLPSTHIATHSHSKIGQAHRNMPPAAIAPVVPKTLGGVQSIHSNLVVASSLSSEVTVSSIMIVTSCVERSVHASMTTPAVSLIACTPSTPLTLSSNLNYLLSKPISASELFDHSRPYGTSIMHMNNTSNVLTNAPDNHCVVVVVGTDGDASTLSKSSASLITTANSLFRPVDQSLLPSRPETALTKMIVAADSGSPLPDVLLGSISASTGASSAFILTGGSVGPYRNTGLICANLPTSSAVTTTDSASCASLNARIAAADAHAVATATAAAVSALNNVEVTKALTIAPSSILMASGGVVKTSNLDDVLPVSVNFLNSSAFVTPSSIRSEDLVPTIATGDHCDLVRLSTAPLDTKSPDNQAMKSDGCSILLEPLNTTTFVSSRSTSSALECPIVVDAYSNLSRSANTCEFANTTYPTETTTKECEMDVNRCDDLPKEIDPLTSVPEKSFDLVTLESKVHRSVSDSLVIFANDTMSDSNACFLLCSPPLTYTPLSTYGLASSASSTLCVGSNLDSLAHHTDTTTTTCAQVPNQPGLDKDISMDSIETGEEVASGVAIETLDEVDDDVKVTDEPMANDDDDVAHEGGKNSDCLMNDHQLTEQCEESRDGVLIDEELKSLDRQQQHVVDVVVADERHGELER